MALVSEFDNNNLNLGNLKCPICFEVPSSKVFQCKYGHIICVTCHPSFSECPQCGTPFGKKAIRTKGLEAMMSEVKVECPFRTEGCPIEFAENLIESHVDSCSFNTVKFGPFIKICKLIGYPYCPFRTNQGNTTEAITHFEREHECIIRESDSAISEFTTFTEMISSNGERDTKIWRPLILNLKAEKCAIMILTIFNGAEKSISWIPFFLPYPQTTSYPSQFQVKFCIAGGGGIGADKAPLKWSITPIDIQNAESYLPHSYPFRIPTTPLIQKYIVEGSLFLQTKVVKDDANAEEVTVTSLDNSIIFTPFDVVTLERSRSELPSAPPL